MLHVEFLWAYARPNERVTKRRTWLLTRASGSRSEQYNRAQEEEGAMPLEIQIWGKLAFAQAQIY